MNLPPFPDSYIPTSPEERLRLLQWGEQIREMERERVLAEVARFTEWIEGADEAVFSWAVRDRIHKLEQAIKEKQ